MDFLDQDLDAMAADALAVDVVYGTTPARGFLNTVERIDLDEQLEQVTLQETTLFLRTGAVGVLTIGSTITVAGVAYLIRDVRLVGDGRQQAVILSAT